MKDKKAIEAKRAEFLTILKKAIENIYGRESWYNSLCVQVRRVDKKEKAQALREIAKRNREISGLIRRLDAIGQEGGLGFAALLGYPPDELTATVLALLLAARLDNSVSMGIRAVQDVMHFAADRDPVAALKIRCMFRSDGALNKVVSLRNSIAIDDASTMLKESAVNRILKLPTEDVSSRCEAEALVGKWSR